MSEEKISQEKLDKINNVNFHWFKNYCNTYNSSCDYQDRLIISLSSATLFASIGYILTTIQKGNPYHAIFLVIISWVLLTLAICSVLLSYKHTIEASLDGIQKAREAYEEDNKKYYGEDKSYHSKMIEKCNTWSIIFFLSGTIVTLFFSIYNVFIYICIR